MSRECEDEKKLMRENAMSIFRAMCNRCHHGDFGKAVDDCVHTKCPIWDYRAVEIVEYIGIERGSTKHAPNYKID